MREKGSACIALRVPGLKHQKRAKKSKQLITKGIEIMNKDEVSLPWNHSA